VLNFLVVFQILAFLDYHRKQKPPLISMELFGWMLKACGGNWTSTCMDGEWMVNKDIFFRHGNFL